MHSAVCQRESDPAFRLGRSTKFNISDVMVVLANSFRQQHRQNVGALPHGETSMLHIPSFAKRLQRGGLGKQTTEAFLTNLVASCIS